MKKRLVVIGGVAAGPKAAAKARRCDPEMEIVLYQEEDDISYAGCGLPYYISGVIGEREDLISRTPGKFSQEGIKILKNRMLTLFLLSLFAKLALPSGHGKINSGILAI